MCALSGMPAGALSGTLYRLIFNELFMRYVLVVCALMTSLATQTAAAAASAPSVHLLCQSHGGHLNEDCLLVNSKGVRLTSELFNTHEDMPTDGMLRTFANVAKASGGYDWRYGFINTQGQVVVPPIYKEANAFSSGLALVTTDEGRAYIDTQGRIALRVAAQWYDAHDFHHGLALVRGEGYMTGTHPMSSVGPRRVAPPWSVIDKTGRIVMGYEPTKDISPATTYTKLEWYSRHGFTTPNIDINSDFIDGKAAFRRNLPSGDKLSDAFGLIDTQGRVVVEPSKKYWREDILRKTYPSLVKSHKPSKTLAKKFYRIEDFHEGLAWTSQCKTDAQGSHTCQTVGFVNTLGQWVFKVDSGAYIVRPFHRGHAVLLIANEYPTNYGQTEALVDRTGRVVANYAELVTLRKPK
jgi:WG containing repeat